MSAFFKPYNRHIVVDIIEDQEEDQKSLVVLPSDYKKPTSPFVKAIVIDVSDDSRFKDELSLNDVILAERRMLHKVEISEYSFYLVLENYIYGRINNEAE